MMSHVAQLGFELLIFVAVLAAAEGALLLLFSDQRTRRRTAVSRLRRRAGQLQEGADGSSTSALRATEQDGHLARFAAAAMRRASLELLLYRAGLLWTPLRFAALTAVSAGAALFLGLLLFSSLALTLALAASGCLLPLVYATAAARGRARRFEEQLPEALDLICRALRAGISLEYGFKSAGEELPDPIGTEFGQVAHEISLGLPLRAALGHLCERAHSRDLPFFATAVLIQRETGGNLAEILENLAEVVRQRLQFQLKVRSLLAQMKLTANLLAALPFVFGALISLASPGYLSPLLDTPIGRQFLYGGLILIALGWVLCRRVGVVRM